MILIRQLKVEATCETPDLIPAVAKKLRISHTAIQQVHIIKRSIDARKKPLLFYIYAVAIAMDTNLEKRILKKFSKDSDISIYQPMIFQMPESGDIALKERPVIVGMGPAGLFCALLLARAGYAPILIERGRAVADRQKDVENFWRTGCLNPESNVQFGEGGAGTFSDGKLNTLTKDKTGRNQFVLETFVEFGAPEQILWDAKPHIGTDILQKVIQNMRKEILRLGGLVYFETKFESFVEKDGALQAITISQPGMPALSIDTQVAVLALGHSARDTFRMLHAHGIAMAAKEFAVGFRVEHPQDMINHMQYKGADMRYLSPASYKLTANFENHRGVYSFCMCPGGYVVNASSEEGRLAVNGMSYHDRAGKNANTAMIVSVTPEDFPGKDALAGVVFQRELEKKAFAMGNGKIPQQLYGDFVKKRISSEYGGFASCTRGKTAFAPLHELLPQELTETFIRGMEQFPRYIEDYNRYDAILSGIESRTSSPVRIWRNEEFESEIKGLYPCGEGAGYAGGIMSAAMDGIKIAEMIAKQYAPVK